MEKVKEIISLYKYYKYSLLAYEIMIGWQKVENGVLYYSHKGHLAIEERNKWGEMTAYHHWLNQDDLNLLLNKLGLNEEEKIRVVG